MKSEEFEKLDIDHKLWEIYKLMCEAGGKPVCSPLRSDLSGVYINNIIENSREMMKEENKIWEEMEEDISEEVII